MKDIKHLILILTFINFAATNTIDTSIEHNNTVLANNNQRRHVEKNNFKETAKQEVSDDDEDDDEGDYSIDESSSKTTIPLVVPAPARITISLNAKKILRKRKKNFSKMAKSLIILNETDYEEFKRYLATNNDTYKFARSFTKSIQSGMCLIKFLG